ncbi:MAG: hypothetical protein J2O49_06970 [Sciscionella sp.]|nr:hypothetical protein [Sciscionella sp.]
MILRTNLNDSNTLKNALATIVDDSNGGPPSTILNESIGAPTGSFTVDVTFIGEGGGASTNKLPSDSVFTTPESSGQIVTSKWPISPVHPTFQPLSAVFPSQVRFYWRTTDGELGLSNSFFIAIAGAFVVSPNFAAVASAFAVTSCIDINASQHDATNKAIAGVRDAATKAQQKIKTSLSGSKSLINVLNVIVNDNRKLLFVYASATPASSARKATPK